MDDEDILIGKPILGPPYHDFLRPFSLLTADVLLVSFFTGLGDFLEQRRLVLIKDVDGYDWPRTKRQAIAALPVGVLYHLWYKWLDSVLPEKDLKIILLKVFLDIGIASPVLWTTYFAVLTLVVEKRGWRLFRQRAFVKGIKLWLVEWAVWPPIQSLNFYLLPTEARVLCDMVVQLAFDTYVSYLLNDSPEKETLPLAAVAERIC